MPALGENYQGCPGKYLPPRRARVACSKTKWLLGRKEVRCTIACSCFSGSYVLLNLLGNPCNCFLFIHCCSPLDCSTAVDLVIVVDASGSIGKKNYETMKKMVIELIRHFSVRRSYARIGIVRYSSSADEIMSPQASQRRGFAALQGKVNRMPYTGGGTTTGLALGMAYSMLMKSRRQLKKFRKIRKYEQVLLWPNRPSI